MSTATATRRARRLTGVSVTERRPGAGQAALPDVRRPRLAISGIFLLVGLMLGTWFARLPELRVQLGLSYGQLGAALLAQMVGVIIAMQLSEPVFARFGGVLAVRCAAMITPWFLPLLAWVHGSAAATAGLLAWGLIAGVLDVGMNTQAVRTERLAERPILSGLHAVWGVGALAGSLLTALAVRGGLTPRAQFLLIAVALSVLAAVSGTYLMTDQPPQPSRAARAAPGLSAFLRGGWTRAVIVLGVLGAAAGLTETSISNWCGIFLAGQRGAPVSLSSLGYTAFIGAETLTRLAGDRLRWRWGPVPLVRSSVAVTVAGLVAVLAGRDVSLDIAGFAIQGCGIAVLIPIITSAAGHGGTSGGSGESLAIARFSTLYYAGVMAGPALTGWLADALGLSAAFGLLIAPLALIGSLAVAVAPAAMRSMYSDAAKPGRPPKN